MNMRGPFGSLDFNPNTGRFGAVVMEAKDRPKITHRGVKVMCYDEHSLTQVHEYPQATSWDVDDRGMLDVWNEDSHRTIVASYPEGLWKRVWFPGAEQNVAFELPEIEEEEESEGPPYIDDVEVGVYDDTEDTDVDSHPR